ncbi:MAG: enoyl-CoA hydratase [Chloroflexi bacterium]|nr:enoyl-CoA hydratase [Chloroflexota bacterium]
MSHDFVDKQSSHERCKIGESKGLCRFKVRQIVSAREIDSVRCEEMMDYQTLLIDQDGAVLKITVNRPEVLNAQSRIMREEYDDALAQAAEDEAVHVVIVAGAGDHFSSGHDLGSPQEREDREKRPYPPGMPGRYKRSIDQNLTNTLRWREFPKPTIAQVQGVCIMGGLMLATSCDLIVAADNAKFADRTVRWGGPHVQYSSLPWEIGVRRAKEALFTGDWIEAEEALRLGMVNRVVPLAKLEEETMALAQRIALQDPFALRLAKMSINQMQDEMGFRVSITSAFQAHALSVAYRQERDGDESQRVQGAQRARNRDATFGDHI